MSHANAPLSIEGRRRLVERCKTRPIAHVGGGSERGAGERDTRPHGAKVACRANGRSWALVEQGGFP